MNDHTRRRFLSQSAVGLGGALAVACGSPSTSPGGGAAGSAGSAIGTAPPRSSAVTAEPTAGGSIVIASPLKGDMLNQSAAEFTKQTGIKADVQYMGSTQVLAKLRAEKSQPRTDVWIGAGGVIPFIVGRNEGLLEPYKSPAFDFPEFQGNVQMRDKDWYWIGAFLLALGWTYGTSKLPDADVPLAMEDYAAAKWKNQIEMSNPEASGTAALFILSTLDRYRKNGKGEDAGWKALEAFANNVKRFPESGGGPAQDASKGDILAGVSFDQQTNLLKVKGEPVEFKLPEQAVILVDPVALVKGAPNPAGGKKFIDFIISKKGQELLQLDAYMSMRADVPPHKVSRYKLEEYLKASAKVDFEWAATNFDTAVRRFREFSR